MPHHKLSNTPAIQLPMENPYAAPESLITPIPVHLTGAEQVRRDHLSHEASVKSIGTLSYLGSILFLIAFWASLDSIRVLHAIHRVQVGMKPMIGSDLALIIGTSLLLLGLMILQWKLAGGLRNLRPWVRIPTIILSVIGLLGFPLGTLISGYILYLMLSAKSKMVFSPEYRQIIADTPHLRYRTSFLRTFLVVILVLAGFIAFGFWFRAVPP